MVEQSKELLKDELELLVKPLISQKGQLFEDIYDLENKLITLKFNLRVTEANLWLHTDWETVIDGRATEKLKKAYVDSQTAEKKRDIARTQTIINAKYNHIKTIDDNIWLLSRRSV